MSDTPEPTRENEHEDDTLPATFPANHEDVPEGYCLDKEASDACTPTVIEETPNPDS